MLPRVVLDELLDQLPAEDPRARRSRRDLQRVNAVMGSARLLARALRRFRPLPGRSRLRILELGAGDGSLMLQVARRIGARWPPVQLQLLDRLALVESRTRWQLQQLGWSAEALTCDVLDWAREGTGQYDLILTNLFLHHFQEQALRGLLAAVSCRCACFIACEPRRSTVALLGSHLIGLIGGNEVTRRDAVLRVRAGFRDQELTRLWGASGWAVQEGPAGLFSHFFSASQCAITRTQ